jgi:DNA-binding beta-propeller fold protein YncE
LTAGAGRSVAATFGTVVPIGGTPSDIALDEPRKVLYIADFGCSCIDVMSLADNTIHSSINVAAFPVGIALSPSGQYLVAIHYANYRQLLLATAPSGGNLVTVINLNTQGHTTYALGDRRWE